MTDEHELAMSETEAKRLDPRWPVPRTTPEFIVIEVPTDSLVILYLARCRFAVCLSVEAQLRKQRPWIQWEDNKGCCGVGRCEVVHMGEGGTVLNEGALVRPVNP